MFSAHIDRGQDLTDVATFTKKTYSNNKVIAIQTPSSYTIPVSLLHISSNHATVTMLLIYNRSHGVKLYLNMKLLQTIYCTII